MNLNLRRNGAWAICEVICSTLILFALYKLVVRDLGLGDLGIWSLVIATTSLMRLADSGASAGLGRFVAISRENRDITLTRSYIDTAILTSAALYSLFAVVLYWPARYGLSVAISDAIALEKARNLLPYAFLSFVLSNITASIVGGLVGLQRSDLKSAVMIIGAIIQLIASWALIPKWNLIGLAEAQIVQNLFGILIGVILLNYALYERVAIFLPHNWTARGFKDLIGFGLKIQITGLVVAAYDPLAKFLLSAFGGLEATGLFEIANRMTYQTRTVVAAPGQVLVPAFALLGETSTQRLSALYRQSIALISIVGVPAMIGVGICSPLASIVFLGSVNNQFVTFTALLSLAWCVNVLSVPAYFLGVGTGRVRWNILGNVVITGGAVILSIGLGSVAGATGVATAITCSQIAGSLFIILMNCRDKKLRPFASYREMAAVVRFRLSASMPSKPQDQKTFDQTG